MRKDLEGKQSKIVALEEQAASKSQTEQELKTATAELRGVREALDAKQKQIALLEEMTASKGKTEQELVAAREEYAV